MRRIQRTCPIRGENPHGRHTYKRRMVMRCLIDPILIISTGAVLVEHNQMRTHGGNRMRMGFMRCKQIANHRIAVQQIIIGGDDVIIREFLQSPEIFLMRLQVIINPTHFNVVPQYIAQALRQIGLTIRKIRFTKPQHDFVRQYLLRKQRTNRQMHGIDTCGIRGHGDDDSRTPMLYNTQNMRARTTQPVFLNSKPIRQHNPLLTFVPHLSHSSPTCAFRS